jgi:hypothetical protein
VHGRVERGEDGAGRVREQVHPVEAQMLAQRLDVTDEPVDTAGGRVHRIGGRPDPAHVRED